MAAIKNFSIRTWGQMTDCPQIRCTVTPGIFSFYYYSTQIAYFDLMSGIVVFIYPESNQSKVIQAFNRISELFRFSLYFSCSNRIGTYVCKNYKTNSIVHFKEGRMTFGLSTKTLVVLMEKIGRIKSSNLLDRYINDQAAF